MEKMLLLKFHEHKINRLGCPLGFTILRSRLRNPQFFFAALREKFLANQSRGIFEIN